MASVIAMIKIKIATGIKIHQLRPFIILIVSTEFDGDFRNATNAAKKFVNVEAPIRKVESNHMPLK